MLKKIIRAIDRCDRCDHMMDGMFGVMPNMCKLANEEIPDFREIPEWCPLDDAEDYKKGCNN